eukprot:8243898-Pyramimonas_sp.AAC.1
MHREINYAFTCLRPHKQATASRSPSVLGPPLVVAFRARNVHAGGHRTKHDYTILSSAILSFLDGVV